MTITIIRCDGTEESHDVPPGGVVPAVKRLIGAETLDKVNLRDGRTMFVDDAGYEVSEAQRQAGPGDRFPVGATIVSLEPVRALKPDNPKATALYHAVCLPGTTHRIVGDVAVVRDEDGAMSSRDTNEYDFSNGERGKYLERVRGGRAMVDFEKIMYQPDERDRTIFGARYTPPERFTAGEWHTVARFEKTGEDGQPVEIDELRAPARFFRIRALASTDSVGEPKRPFTVSTASGDEMGQLAVRLAEHIAEGALSLA